MFPFTYTFKIEIKGDKTLKNITDVVCDSFMEREMNNIEIKNNIITGKGSLITLDFSNRYPLTISPGKEYFMYHESTKILTYKVDAFFNLIYASALFLILYFFVHHWVIELVIPTIFFILTTITSYYQYQIIINKIAKKLN